MKEPIRILQVLGRLDRGGAETMLMNLYRCIDRERLQFDFVIHTTDVCDYTEEIERLGGRIYSMKPFGVSTAGEYRKQWRCFFKEHPEYKVVHGHMRSTASLYFAEAKKAGLITIAHSHNTSSGRGISAMVKNVLQYPLRFQADYLFACSKMAGEWLYGKNACKSNRFHLLLNGIDPEKFTFSSVIREEKRKELQLDKDTKVFLHVGRLEPQKNHRFLISVMKEIHNIDNRTMLLLCGVGPLQEEIQKQAQREGIDSNVRFLGVRDDVSALMQAADVFLFPSLFEGLPVTVVEAQATGLPVMQSDRITKEVCLTDLVKVLSLESSPKEWAKQALEITDTDCIEDSLRASYAAKIAAGGYDVKKNAIKLAEFYESLAKENA